MPPPVPGSPIPSLPELGSLGIQSSSSASNGPFSGGGAHLGRVTFDNRRGNSGMNYALIGVVLVMIILLFKFK
ncbi:hypothetical protein TW74_02720 [Vibrio nigripulchritudo]|nr:hypothetical protein TW74_02720 [Vibrio nigripulchritudo]